MDSWKLDRATAAIEGRNPTVMARTDSGFAVKGDVQWLPGYSVLITDRPGVDRLTDLPRAERAAFMNSVDILAEAVERACASLDPQFLRVNIEILGNTDPFLHAHIWPRYQWEEADIRAHAVWLYPRTQWTSPESALNASHDPIRAAITAQIEALRNAE